MKWNDAKPMRWGIIGCGDVTEVKSGPAYQQTEGFQLTAVMRRDVEKLKDYAKRHSIEKYYTNADELIQDDEIDAVYIATPPDSHRYYALKVAEAGKPCCIEKPMAPCYADSLAILQAFEEKKLPLFIAYYRRSLPRFTQVAAWLKNHEIGDVRHISSCLSVKPSEIDLSKAYNWRTDAKIAPGGYFDDLASHELNMFTFLLGDIREASGMKSNQQQLYDAPDAVTGCWVHENGVTGNGVWNFGCDSEVDRVEIFGSKGKIQFSIFQDNPLLLTKNGVTHELFIENPKHIQIHYVEDIAKHLLGENYTHPSTGQSGAHTSWVMDQILGV